MDFPELVKLFAANSVAKIDTIREYRELCDRHVGDDQFDRQRLATEEAKRTLEVLLDKQQTYKAQVYQVLKRLYAQGRNARRQEDFDLYDLYRLLIREGYASRWSVGQRAYFEGEAERIKSGTFDAFISFTNRSPDLGDKRINRRYFYFIKAVIGPDYVTSDDLRAKNLLAKAFYYLLKDESLEGFYYPDYEGDSAVVLEELEKALKKSRVFVQLVENVIFNPPAAGPNYCEFEYRKAVGLFPKDLVLFVAAERSRDDLEDPELVYPRYQDWLEDVRRKSVHYLPPVEVYSQQGIEARIEDIRQKLSKVVVQVKELRLRF